VLLTDFAAEMLRLSLPKLAASGPRRPLVTAADACQLPLRDASCTGLTAAFGFRNLRSAQAGLLEAHRVLRPGGRLAILEFYRPTSALGRARAAFVQVFVPAVAWCVAREHAGAYGYLVRSIAHFLTVEAMCRLMEDAGFTRPEVHSRLMGTVTILGATRR
jgi:ubiquinone/menaquinone biosynthesis C-methylase UbiE